MNLTFQSAGVVKTEVYIEVIRSLKRAGVEIDENGAIIINNKEVIVINNLKPLEHRLKVLAISFLEYNLDRIYIVPYLRSFIEQFRYLDSKT